MCPTHIRIACATFGCKADGIDSGYFAKHFMKNKENTTQIHYNLYANHREALKLAMLMGNTFEVGGEKVFVKKEEFDKLTNAIISNEKVLPTKEQIMAWVNKRDKLDAKELASFDEILMELDSSVSMNTFYSSNKKSNKVTKNTMKGGERSREEVGCTRLLNLQRPRSSFHCY